MRERVLSVTIKDCEVQTFRSGGKGGQNQNKRDTGVRIVHHASGARGESREQRSQLQNKQSAFKKMAESNTFQAWLRMQTGKAVATEAEILRRVEADMAPGKIQTETRHDGEWITEGE